jgi:competence protein ComEA
MNARQRGATFLLVLVLAGRGIDALDLPWEHNPNARDGTRRLADEVGAREDSLTTPPPPAADATETAETAPTQTTPLAINQATESQLQALPGIGPVLAARIVAFRGENGPFADMAALRRVKGVGPRMSERLAPLLRFE